MDVLPAGGQTLHHFHTSVARAAAAAGIATYICGRCLGSTNGHSRLSHICEVDQVAASMAVRRSIAGCPSIHRWLCVCLPLAIGRSIDHQVMVCGWLYVCLSLLPWWSKLLFPPSTT